MPRDFPENPATLPDALERAARSFPTRGIAIFDGRGRSHERRTYPQLLAAVRAAAGRWESLGVGRGDRILVGLPTSWELLECWMGAMWLGALPFAVAPPGGFGAADGLVGKIEGLVEQLGVRYAVISGGFREQARERGAETLVRVAITPQEQAGAAAHRAAAVGEPEECAFLQLTSGSTGLPRAVMISHFAAIHNGLGIDRSLDEEGAPMHAWADALVSWLPLHHDMGLVGNVWTAILTGLDLWMFPPTVFLARPGLWLSEIGKHGRTVAHGPNFGYQLCVERLEAEGRQGLDLSGWGAAETGAEMVRPETMASFVEAFAPCGLRPEVLRPCYGLAETTLAVTVDRRGRGVRTRPLPPGASGSPLGDTEVVCVGAALPETELRITDAAGGPAGDGAIGEVRVRTPSLMMGYYEDPEATAEALVDGWHRTGDLGFLHDDELYLTGRIKDILILRGTNFMPHEIEWLAEGATGGGGSFRSGAFSVAHGPEGEEAVLVVEAGERDATVRAEVERDIRLQVAHALGVNLAEVVFVRRGQIPKTTSGKVQRRELRQMYLDGALRARESRSA